MDGIAPTAQRFARTAQAARSERAQRVAKWLFGVMALAMVLPLVGIVAYLLWRETGDPSHFGGIAQDAAVMNIDDMLCVGATGPFVLSSTIGRNKSLAGGEAVAAVINGFHAFAARLAALGTELVIGGGETADVGDLVRTITVDATCAARLRRDEVIDNGAIGPGDLIVALSGTGAATYEDKENSGIGSNGLPR